MAYQLINTTAGKNAAIAANTAGATVAITQIGIGTGRYNPVNSLTALSAEVIRVNILKSIQLSATVRQLDYEVPGSALFPGSVINPIGEIGVYLSNGTLFSVWSDTLSIPAAKSATTTLRGSLFLVLDDIPPGSIVINAIRFDPIVIPMGGFGGEGDLNLASGTTTLGGKRRLRNFYLRSGATLIVDTLLQLECSGEAVFEPGSIVSLPPVIPGGASVSMTGTGSQNVIFGLVPGQNFGAVGGYAQIAKKYPMNLSPVGSGGQSGAILKSDATSMNVSTGSAGAGAGAMIVNAQVGIRIGGTFNGNGGNAANPSINPNTAGTCVVSGGGGGSGAGLSFATPGYATIDSSMIANLNGGNGSDGIRTTTAPTTVGAAPGSGGVGGTFEFISPNQPITFPGTLNNLGGMSGNFNAGTITTATSSYTAGGTGAAFGFDAAIAFSLLVPTRQAAGKTTLGIYMP